MSKFKLEFYGLIFTRVSQLGMVYTPHTPLGRYVPVYLSYLGSRMRSSVSEFRGTYLYSAYQKYILFHMRSSSTEESCDGF
jgi:hypothetical protein